MSRLNSMLVSCSLAAAVLLLPIHPPPAQAGTAPARGRILFLRCASCHDISTGKSLKIGPNLLGVIGRKVAGQPGYPYSDALRAQQFVWDEAQMDRWLRNPGAVAPGTAMAFGGIADEADRRQIIAYLQAQSAANSQ